MKDQIRLIAALDPDGGAPSIVGALDETIWELISPDDWEQTKRGMIEASGIAEADYAGIAEIVVTVDHDALKAAGQTPIVEGEVVTE